MGYNENDENYNFIDINDYTTEELLKDDLIISKAMLIEKSQDEDTLIENMKLIGHKAIKEKSKNEEYLLEILKCFILKDKDKKIAEEILEEIRNGKEDKTSMMNVERIIEESFARREKKGWNDCKNEIVIQMIKNNINDKTICKISKISAKELQKIKDSIK